MTTRWVHQSERGSRFLVVLIGWITLKVGRWAARLLLYPITLYFILTAREQRVASRKFLSRVMGRKASWWKVARHFHVFAGSILDRVYLVAGDHRRFDLQMHGVEAALEQVEKGRGCILLGAHLGSFEVMRMLAMLDDRVEVKVLMYEEHNATLTGLIYSLNPRFSESVIPLGAIDSLLRVQECLARGELVGVLGDRVAENDRVTRCQFLGQQATFPSGPMLLASVLKVPVQLFFGLYLGNNRYALHFELFADEIVIRREHRDADIQMWTQRYAERLEHYARLAPYNWFNFYDFWGED
ncbi:MAG: lipid A biosynthesis acyltransferase [Gammaproteobacteria bacterium]|nr:lipid A biosynthesis acyltransferase [Gammaproteobacteria bacterium]